MEEDPLLDHDTRWHMSTRHSGGRVSDAFGLSPDTRWRPSIYMQVCIFTIFMLYMGFAALFMLGAFWRASYWWSVTAPVEVHSKEAYIIGLLYAMAGGNAVFFLWTMCTL